MGLVTAGLTFDHLTLKLVSKSHLRWGTFVPNLGTLGLWVLQLFAMYVTTDKNNAYCPFPTGGMSLKTMTCDRQREFQYYVNLLYISVSHH